MIKDDFINNPYLDDLDEIIRTLDNELVLPYLSAESKMITEEKEICEYVDFFEIKLMAFYGDRDRLYKSEDQRTVFIDGLINYVIKNISTHQFFMGMYIILSGKTKFNGFPPTPGEFLVLCKESPKVPIPNAQNPLLLATAKIKSEAVPREIALKYINKLKEDLKARDGVRQEAKKIAEKKEEEERKKLDAQLEEIQRDLERIFEPLNRKKEGENK